MSQSSWNPGSRLKPTRPLPRRELAGETVIVDPRTRKVFLMNTVGGVVWAGVERQATRDQIVADVVARFRVEAAQAGVDVDKFLSELLAVGLAVPL